MRAAGPSEPTRERASPVTTTVRDAVPVLAESAHPVLAVEGDEIVGVVDREAVLRAIAGEGD